MLALLGRRVPVPLKIFVTALAIVDDLGAVAIIALFYTAKLSLPWLAAAGAITAGLVVLNRLRVRALRAYLLAGLGLWVCMLQSGLHATLAGVAVAFTVPLARSPGEPDHAGSPLHGLEHALHRWVAFGVVPMFGFVNAGVSLAGLGLSSLMSPVTLGVTLGLFLGKQIGVFISTWLAVQLGWADRPEHAWVLAGVRYCPDSTIGAWLLLGPAILLIVLGVCLGALVVCRWMVDE